MLSEKPELESTFVFSNKEELTQKQCKHEALEPWPRGSHLKPH